MSVLFSRKLPRTVCRHRFLAHQPRLSVPLVRRCHRRHRHRLRHLHRTAWMQSSTFLLNSSWMTGFWSVRILAPYCSGYDFVRQKWEETCGCWSNPTPAIVVCQKALLHPTPVPLPPTPTPSSAPYCPGPSNVFFTEYGNVQWSSSGWTMYGNARASSKASLNGWRILGFCYGVFSCARKNENNLFATDSYCVSPDPCSTVVPRWTSQKTTVTVFRQPRSLQNFVVSPATFPSSHRYGMG